MLKKIILIAGVSMSLVAPVCFGQFGLPAKPSMGGGSTSGASAADVDAFLESGKASSELINKSRDLLVMAISSKEERAKRQASLDQIKEGLKTGDKKAAEAQKKMQQDDEAKLKGAEHDKAAQENLKNLSSAQKEAVGYSMGNLGLGLLMQTVQVKVGENILKTASSNMALASKLPALKDGVSGMLSNIGTLGELVTKLPPLFKTAGIKIEMPKDASSKPKEVKDPGFS